MAEKVGLINVFSMIFHSNSSRLASFLGYMLVNAKITPKMSKNSGWYLGDEIVWNKKWDLS